MKRIICFMLVLTIGFGLGGCTTGSSNETTGNTEKVNPSESVNNTKQTTPSTNESNDNEKDGNVLQVPTKDIYFTYPADWMISEGIETSMVMASDECLVGVCYNWHNSFGGDLVKLIASFSPGFLNDAYSYCKGNISASEIKVQNTQNAKVGSFDGVKFNGTVNNKGEWDCHVYGYTVHVNGVSLMIIGLVSTKAQDVQMINDIDDITDQIAASIRTEK